METEQDTVRDRIAQEAGRLFTRFGVRNVTMDDIAERLRISKRTIYERYRDKDALLLQCITEQLNAHRREREEILAQASNVVEGIVGVIHHAAEVMQQSNPSLLREIERYHPQVMEVIRRFREEQEYGRSVELIQQGVREGLFVAGIDPHLVTRLLFVQIDALSNDLLFPPDHGSQVAAMHTVLVTFVRGIATQEGRAMLDLLLEQKNIRARA